MSEGNNNNRTFLNQIIATVVITLLVGSTSPWWWKYIERNLIPKTDNSATGNDSKTDNGNKDGDHSNNSTSIDNNKNNGNGSENSGDHGKNTQLTEDCWNFNPNNVRLRSDGSRWLLTDGRSRMLLFENQQEARKSLKVIQNYNMDSHCFVGRPNPSFEYWLVNGGPPKGAIANEDCIAFNPSDTTVTQVNGRWKIVEGGRHWMFDLNDNESEARKAMAIINKYGFTYSCFVGRPNPEFQYLRD